MPSNRTAKKLIWLVTTITGVLAFLWELESQIGVKHEEWSMLGVNVIIASVVVGGIYIFLNYSSWQFAKFLKLEDHQSITLVIGAYQDIRRWTEDKPKSEKERYFKIKDGREVLLEGAHGYLTGLDTTKMIARFAYRLRDLTDRKILVIADDRSPAEDGPLICFGSPRSNFQSQLFLPPFVQFSGAAELTVTINSTPLRYAPDKDKDYGIVSRNLIGNKWGFVCAGIDEEGTIASGFYLLEHWQILNRYAGPFVHIISCTKAAPESPSRFLGFSPRDTGEWVADGIARP